MGLDLDELHAAMDVVYDDPTIPHPLLEAIWDQMTRGAISLKHWDSDPTMRRLRQGTAIADWLYSLGDAWPRRTSRHHRNL